MNPEDFLSDLSDGAANVSDVADQVGGLIQGVQHVLQPSGGGQNPVVVPVQPMVIVKQPDQQPHLIDPLLSAFGIVPSQGTRLAGYVGCGLLAGGLVAVMVHILK